MICCNAFCAGRTIIFTIFFHFALCCAACILLHYSSRRKGYHGETIYPLPPNSTLCDVCVEKYSLVSSMKDHEWMKARSHARGQAVTNGYAALKMKLCSSRWRHCCGILPDEAGALKLASRGKKKRHTSGWRMPSSSTRLVLRAPIAGGGAETNVWVFEPSFVLPLH